MANAGLGPGWDRAASGTGGRIYTTDNGAGTVDRADLLNTARTAPGQWMNDRYRVTRASPGTRCSRYLTL